MKPATNPGKNDGKVAIESSKTDNSPTVTSIGASVGTKRSRISPASSAKTPTNDAITAPLSLPKPSPNSVRPIKYQKVSLNETVRPAIQGNPNKKVCTSCGDSINKTLSSLTDEIVQRVLRAVMLRLEKLERDSYDLSKEMRKVSQTLTKQDPDFSLCDKLVSVPNENSSTNVTPSKEPMETDNFPVSLEETNPSCPTNPSSCNKWAMMHDEQLSVIKQNESTRSRNPKATKAKRVSFDIKNMTPDACLDIAIKEWAFSSDFGLPLKPSQTFAARLTTIQGELIATGYDRVVVDGESILLEIAEANLLLNKFRPRKHTSSRHFHTFSGVTAHHQLETELGLSPRRHKFAIKVKRNLPSCRLKANKWYVHAHQVRIETEINGRRESRRLQTNRLISILRSVFGHAYFPRSHGRPSSNRHQANSSRTKFKPDVCNTTEMNTTNTFVPTSTLTNNYPHPLLAPQPWLNPTYYTGQLPHSGMLTAPCNISSTYALKQPQQMQQCAMLKSDGTGNIETRGTQRKQA